MLNKLALFCMTNKNDCIYTCLYIFLKNTSPPRTHWWHKIHCGDICEYSSRFTSFETSFGRLSPYPDAESCQKFAWLGVSWGSLATVFQSVVWRRTSSKSTHRRFYAPLVLWGTCSPYSHPYCCTRLASSSRSEFKKSGHKSAWWWHWEGRMAT